MITIIGTAHIAALRDKVRDAIVEAAPKAVCVELDKNRFEALQKGTLGINPIELFQEYIAALYGSRLGNDMLGAVDGANEVRAKIFFIDLPIEETMNKIAFASTYELFNPMEIYRKILAIVAQPLPLEGFSLSTMSSFKDWLDEAIRLFEASPERYRVQLGLLYPLYSRILLGQREEHMAEEIRKIAKDLDTDRIGVVVGLAHVTALKKLLYEFQTKTLTISQL